VSGAILVTGGASGIGRATVEAVIAGGWRAVALDLPGPNLDAALASLDPGPARCTALDVSDEAAVAAEVAAVERDFGPIEGVVNSAGIARDQAMLTTRAEDFRRILEVNVIGSFLVARAAARAMRGRGGAIVNVASVSGIQGNEGRVAYGASKGAVITMTRVMAVELAPLGIRVNVIAPGPIETPMVREVHNRRVRDTWMASVPMRRYGAPEEIAAAAVFLLDPAKSGYVTGQTLAVNGGFTIAGILTGTAAAANAEG
jgi:NAD(P)-dependent dehydrogenase (short-subunit alcohol dehydrogenase family)